MIRKLGLLFLLFSLATTANAAWQLDNSNSWLSFLFVKKQDTAEVGKFKRLSGKVDDNGKAQLKIDLASVDTNILIRDERMQAFLFQTLQYPYATLTADFPIDKINKLAVGEMMVQPVSVQLDFHGAKQDINGNVVVTRLAEDRLLVVSQTVLFVKAAYFDLVKGIDILRGLAGLPRISSVVSLAPLGLASAHRLSHNRPSGKAAYY